MADMSPYVGKIDGIDIQVHWISILFLLFTLLVGLYFFLLWFIILLCILLHELAHSITAKRNRVGIRKILLILPLGGGSIIKDPSIKPDVEFRITLAGPLVSIMLGLAFGILSIFIPGGLARSMVQLLFLINIALGVLNLVPWFPLDGGRLLRSYLQKTRSFFDSTKISVDVSKVVTAVFVIGTIVFAAFFMGSYSFGYREFVVLIDIIMAMFIYSGAQGEMQATYAKEYSKGMRTSDLMSTSFILAKPTWNIRQIHEAMVRQHNHIILFMNGKSVRYIPSISYQSLRKPPGRAVTAMDISREIPAVRRNTTVTDVIDIMRNEESAMVAVVEGQRIIGYVLAQHLESMLALRMHEDSVRKAGTRKQ